MQTIQAEALPAAQSAAYQEKAKLGAEAAITVHRVVEAFDTEKKSINVIHSDLFDSRPKVVLSAISAISKIGDPRSFRFIARLLSHRDETIQIAAVRAAGEIAHPSAKKIILDLFKTSGSEILRCGALEALAKIDCDDQQVSSLIREYSSSLLVSPETRAFARGILLKKQDGSVIEEMLSESKAENIDQIYSEARINGGIALQVLQHGIPRYHRLSAKNRSALVSIASPFTEPDSGRVFLEALGDPDSGVRGNAYSLIGSQTGLVGRFEDIIHMLAEGVEMLPALEEEVHRAIDRMEKCLMTGPDLPGKTKEKVFARIIELYRQLRITERRVSSDTHELGWLITRSKEYVEYYVDEDLRQSIIQLLKGSSNYSPEELVQALRSSAVRVEVRHFEGYSALADIIKASNQPGKALIARELTLAKLGKRKILTRLIRNLRLSRLFLFPGSPEKISGIIEEIYSWAKESKLYRLAEAALFALAKIDSRKTTQACQECMTTPVLSKILAIAAMHLLGELDWDLMESSVIKLISGTDDAYILLNMIDALSASGFSLSGDLIKTLLNTLKVSNHREVLSRISEFLGEQASFTAFKMLKEIFHQGEEGKQEAVLSIIDRMIVEKRVSNRDGLSEFLYRILRQGSRKNTCRAATLLWKLKDDYAAKVLKGLLLRGDIEEQLNILKYLKTDSGGEIAPVLFSLFQSDNANIQEALREALLSAEGKSTQEKILEMVLSSREDMSFEGDGKAKTSEVKVDFHEEKKAFQFEQEHMQRLAILFTDIQDYTKKAQLLSTMQLTSLIQEYEGILLPVISLHRGELIKKMGDGHLFVFQSPLNAVLAAVRLQKSLKRFNSYREESSRIIIRIGIHWGKVMRKQGDVLGNHVNIAARLENAARGGAIYISRSLYEQLNGYIHCREIGLVNVKGIAEAIMVYEPFETVLDLPEEMDPLNSERGLLPENEKQVIEKVPGEHHKNKVLNINQDVLNYIVETFSSLNGLCRKAEGNEIEVTAIRRELVKRWSGLRNQIKAGMSE